MREQVAKLPGQVTGDQLVVARRARQHRRMQRLDLFDSPRRDIPGLYAPSFMGRRPDLYGAITRSTEPVTLFDAAGQTTPLEEQNRRTWLDTLRGYMQDK